MASTGPTLTCQQCGYVNEPERVYCHNCGQKLDRSVLPKEADLKKRENPAKARKRIWRMTNPDGSVVKRGAKTLGKILLWAAGVAALIQLLRPPGDLPPDRNELAMRLISSELTEAVDAPQPRAIAFTETEVNAHLRQTVKGATEGNLVPGLKFDRTFVHFHPGMTEIHTQHSLYGFPLYSSVMYRLQVQNNAFVPTLVGGSFGSLPVHPLLMQYLDFNFRPLWAGMKRERNCMEKLREIRVEEDRIILVTRGAVR